MSGNKNMLMAWLALTVSSIAFVLSTQSALASDEKALWQALRTGEAFAIMRHALAPGTGDPANFSLDDCSTQRNLSEDGRAQARKIGERFRQNGIELAKIYTSAWCRCKETAELLALGDVNVLEALNSFWRDQALARKQTQNLKQWLTSNESQQPTVLVTHYINILELTGATTSSGEIIVAKIRDDQKIIVLGSLP